jgi:hypothetical protein
LFLLLFSKNFLWDRSIGDKSFCGLPSWNVFILIQFCSIFLWVWNTICAFFSLLKLKKIFFCFKWEFHFHSSLVCLFVSSSSGYFHIFSIDTFKQFYCDVLWFYLLLSTYLGVVHATSSICEMICFEIIREICHHLLRYFFCSIFSITAVPYVTHSSILSSVLMFYFAVHLLFLLICCHLY